jgi:hypothetical protein
VATIDVRGPFEVLKRPLTLLPHDTNRVAQASPAADKEGLLAWWKFDESEGVSAADASEHHFAAQLKGPAHWAPTQGLIGGALEFDGAKNYLECADVADFDVGNRMAVAVWFKAHSAAKTAKRSQALVAKGDSWQIERRASDGTLEFHLDGPATATNSPSMGRPPVLVSKRHLDDDQWHHVVGSYDGQRTVLYVDGIEDSSIATSGLLAVTTASLTVGESGVNRGNFYGGWIDDVRLYSRGLSADEVKSLYSAGRK